jgi:hypothetical protein
MSKRGFHSTYLGAHSIVRAHPVGVENIKKSGRASILPWADPSKASEKLIPMIAPSGPFILTAKRKKKLIPNCITSQFLLNYKFSSNFWNFDNLTLQLGIGRKGFRDFHARTKTKIIAASSKDFRYIADTLNIKGHRTFGREIWDATLVEAFLFFWASDLKKNTRNDR